MANVDYPSAENSMATDKDSEWKTSNERFFNWLSNFFYDNIRTCIFEQVPDIRKHII